MDKLLHSKTLKSNLFKWILLYVCALFVVTTVVTYSRYISSAIGTDKARTAKFNVTLTKGDICSSLSGECGLDSYKPYDPIEYNFTVDTTEIEVSTDLVTTVEVNNQFTIMSISDGTNEVDLTDVSNHLSESLGDVSISYYNNSNRVSISSEVGPSKTNIRNYVVTIKYTKTQDPGYLDQHKFTDNVLLEYSATQKD